MFEHALLLYKAQTTYTALCLLSIRLFSIPLSISYSARRRNYQIFSSSPHAGPSTHASVAVHQPTTVCGPPRFILGFIPFPPYICSGHAVLPISRLHRSTHGHSWRELKMAIRNPHYYKSIPGGTFNICVMLLWSLIADRTQFPRRSQGFLPTHQDGRCTCRLLRDLQEGGDRVRCALRQEV